MYLKASLILKFAVAPVKVSLDAEPVNTSVARVVNVLDTGAKAE